VVAKARKAAKISRGMGFIPVFNEPIIDGLQPDGRNALSGVG
jgi:hypothetical protein